jgi:hypothetical protein
MRGRRWARSARAEAIWARCSSVAARRRGARVASHEGGSGETWETRSRKSVITILAPVIVQNLLGQLDECTRNSADTRDAVARAFVWYL